ncbi:MAG: TldD/PmbA family protein, partial [Actinobacteria bacterium]|nr:TldD/PmbA family protein [Actinomycetota bacterium]
AYADARFGLANSESLHARNGELEGLHQSESGGVGVRALIGSSWGFFAVAEPSEATARQAGYDAAAIAKASTRVPGPPLELADVPVTTAEWTSGWLEHPADISLAEKGDLLVDATFAMHEVEGVSVGEAHLQAWDTQKWFVSSQGHRIFQHLVETGASMSATAVGEHETQRRSYGGIGGYYGTAGYELVRETDLAGNAHRVAEEAVALLSAPECPTGVTDLILGSEQLALQVHESVGHAIELDRILGWEAAFAGTSFLDLSQLGTFRYGSDLMNITADATLPGALGSFGYDDEGTPAQRVDIVRDGVWVGVLSGRDSAHVTGLPPGGMVRAEGWSRLPMVRMTNVGLLPGASSFEEMVAATDDGVYMETNRSWSIDDKRLNFQFGCEAGYEIKNGKIGRLVRNPTYTGITPQFWDSMDMVGGRDEWIFWGTPNCGKGQPMQIGHTGHPAVPARFRGVRVGVRGR